MQNHVSFGGIINKVEGSRVNFLSGCLNYFSCLLLIPFSLKWDQTASCYVIRSHLLQKIFYGTGIIYVMITSLFWTGDNITLIREHPENMINIFEMIMQPCITVYHIYLAQIFLFQQARLKNVLKRLGLLSNSTSIFKVRAICSILLLCVFLNCIVLPSNCVIRKGFSRLIKWILSDIIDSTCYPAPIISNSTLNQFVQLTYYLSYPWMLQYCMPEVLCVSIVLSYFYLAQTFQFRINNIEVFEEGYVSYKEYKSVIHDMNGLWGPIFLVMYVADVIYYAKAPYVVMTENPDVIFCIFLLGNLIIWGVGAQIHKMMTTTTKEWIKKQEECVISLENRLKLLALSYEVDSEPMGISCTFFTLTYPFLGSMFGLLVTYALIIYQQQQH